MYHGVGYRKLGKKTPHRMAMFANAATSLIEHERIETTLPKAKDLRRIVDRLVTKGKSGSEHDRRNVFSFLRSNEAVNKLFTVLAPRFKDRQGGYTRVLKLAETRRGDAADMAVLEFVDYVLPAEKSKDEVKKDKAAAKAKQKEAAKAKAAARPAKPSREARGGRKTTGKAGTAGSLKGGGSGSRGT
jgi:large subunit ribosomal protein L17